MASLTGDVLLTDSAPVLFVEKITGSFKIDLIVLIYMSDLEPSTQKMPPAHGVGEEPESRGTLLCFRELCHFKGGLYSLLPGSVALDKIAPEP